VAVYGRFLLHITTRSAWDKATSSGVYAPASLEVEGFVHLSEPDQVVRVANARYAGGADLVLLCIDRARLGAPVKYEIGDPGSDERFPHLYGAIEIDAVVAVLDFRETATGFELPPGHDFE
jgi:uncharacterized protein (DUF952 family)